MDFEQFQGDYMSDIWKIWQNGSSCVIRLYAYYYFHNLVKSLMDKLHHSIQFPQSPPFYKQVFEVWNRGIQSSFIKAKRPELTNWKKVERFRIHELLWP